MKKLTRKDFKKFMELKQQFERKIEQRLRDEGKIKEDDRVELEVDWLAYDSMAEVTVYNLDDLYCDNTPRVYDIPFSDLYEGE